MPVSNLITPAPAMLLENIKLRDGYVSHFTKLLVSQGKDVLFDCEGGSWNYGTAGPDSDFDIRMIFVDRDLTNYIHHSLCGKPTLALKEGIADFHAWDLFKLIELSIKGNPTAIEWIWSSYQNATVLGRVLIETIQEYVVKYVNPAKQAHHYANLIVNTPLETYGDAKTLYRNMFFFYSVVADKKILTNFDLSKMDDSVIPTGLFKEWRYLPRGGKTQAVDPDEIPYLIEARDMFVQGRKTNLVERFTKDLVQGAPFEAGAGTQLYRDVVSILKADAATRQ